MTREQLKKHWEVIEAYKNGADVEWRLGDAGTWMPIGDSPYFFTDYQYRIAQRDWAWACKMMLAGKKVTRSEMDGKSIGLNGFTIAIFSDNTTGRTATPVTISSFDLTATDWRLA